MQMLAILLRELHPVLMPRVVAALLIDPRRRQKEERERTLRGERRKGRETGMCERTRMGVDEGRRRRELWDPVRSRPPPTAASEQRRRPERASARTLLLSSGLL